MNKVVFIILVVFTLGVKAQTPREIWYEANQAYQRSEYSYAIELYEQLLEMDVVAADLYYNLGNAYFKNNNLGKAILNYERALKLNPSDDNIHHNLRIANNRTIDDVEQRAQLFYERWWRNTFMMQSANAWAIWGIMTLCLFLATTSVYLFSRTIGIKKSAFYFSLLLLSVTILSMIFAQKQYNRLNNTSEAIIMSPRVTAKSSPSAQSPDLFLVHEGTKVFIRSSLGDWYEINLANGNVGWIKRETIEII